MRDENDAYEMRERREVQEDDRREEMEKLRATRDRYEAALREIAKMHDGQYSVWRNDRWMTAQDFAREALAAAQEDTND